MSINYWGKLVFSGINDNDQWYDYADFCSDICWWVFYTSFYWNRVGVRTSGHPPQAGHVCTWECSFFSRFLVFDISLYRLLFYLPPAILLRVTFSLTLQMPLSWFTEVSMQPALNMVFVVNTGSILKITTGGLSYKAWCIFWYPIWPVCY